MSTDRLMDEKDVIYLYNELLLSYKKKDIMQFTTTWMYLEVITLSEVSQRTTNIA